MRLPVKLVVWYGMGNGLIGYVGHLPWIGERDCFKRNKVGAAC